MEVETYFAKIIDQLESTFDMDIPYVIGNRKYLGYAYFYNNSSRYVFVKEAKIWETDAYEHIIFMEDIEGLNLSFEHAKYLITDYMEKKIVREGKKYPPTNHMYSFLTVVIFTKNDIDISFENKIKKFKFIKNYLFTIRGYSEGKIVVININDLKIISNQSGENLKENFENLLNS